jgi:serine/threonine protein kinase
MISNDGQMKLLDFGAAREFAESGNKSLSIMLKPGYAPEEQYRSRGVQGPWTDIYALCATMYKCITGVTPDESSERMRSDAVQPPSQLGISIDPAQEAAMMKGMTVLQEDRWQSVGELYGALYQAQAVPVVAPQPVSVAPPMPAPTTKPAAVVADIVTPKSSAGNKKKFILGGIVTAVIAVMVIVVAAMNGNGGGSIYVPTPHDEGSLSTNSTPSPIDSSPSPNVITAPSPLPQTAHYTRTITLGQFICENTDNRSQQKGWCTKGVEIDDGSVTSPWSAKDFTSSRYLILEFGKEPAGNIDFVWKGDTNDWGWTQTSGLTPQGDKIVIDLHTINGYYQYMRSSELLIYLCYYSDSWDDLPVKDAYFANAQ